MHEVLNVPIKLLEQFAQTHTGMKILACAIMVRCRFVNGRIYHPTVTKIAEVLNVSRPTARKYWKLIMDSCLFTYDEEKDQLIVKSFKSTEKREFGRRHKFMSADDFCVKVSVDIRDMKLGQAVKTLRKLIMKHVIVWNQRKETLNKHLSKNTCVAPAQKSNPIKLRDFASCIGMSKASSSRYVKEMVNDGEVCESTVVKEPIAYTYSHATYEECKRRYPNDYICPMASSYYHGLWFWRIRGRMYSLVTASEWSRFQHVIYDHKVRKSTIYASKKNSMANALSYLDNFYTKGRVY